MLPCQLWTCLIPVHSGGWVCRHRMESQQKSLKFTQPKMSALHRMFWTQGFQRLLNTFSGSGSKLGSRSQWQLRQTQAWPQGLTGWRPKVDAKKMVTNGKLIIIGRKVLHRRDSLVGSCPHRGHGSLPGKSKPERGPCGALFICSTAS